MEITASRLLELAPNAKQVIVTSIVALQSTILESGIDTPLCLCHFLAQLCHESDGLRTTVEYASGKAYEMRKSLGNVNKGDGVKYKGRGLIQLTGRANYAAFAKSPHSCGKDVVSCPAEVEQFPLALTSALFFWMGHNLNHLANKDDLQAITRVINGGMNGYHSRRTYLNRAKSIWLSHRVLMLGSSGPEVANLQKRLVAHGYSLVVDGIFGRQTDEALRYYQWGSGQVADGVYDTQNPCVLDAAD